MTSPSGGLGGTEPRPVDRQWFEEALRTQGFVVEPPPDVEGPVEPVVVRSDADHPEPVEPARSAPGRAEPEAGTRSPDLVGGDDGRLTSRAPLTTAGVPEEGPPVPSALLARIAARGQGGRSTEPGTSNGASPQPSAADPDTTATPEVALATAEPDPTAEPEVAHGVVLLEVGPVATAEPDETSWQRSDEAAESPAAAPRPAPWESATTAGVATPAGVAFTAAVPETDGPSDVEPQVVAEPDADAELGVAPEPAIDPEASAVLESPYVPVGAAGAAGAVATRPGIPPTQPEASEGELWALVGAAAPTAARPATSNVPRIVLTVFTAFAILIIVVGSLVIASQIA